VRRRLNSTTTTLNRRVFTVRRKRVGERFSFRLASGVPAFPMLRDDKRRVRRLRQRIQESFAPHGERVNGVSARRETLCLSDLESR
jgi:hypothetical protein